MPTVANDRLGGNSEQLLLTTFIIARSPDELPELYRHEGSVRVHRRGADDWKWLLGERRPDEVVKSFVDDGLLEIADTDEYGAYGAFLWFNPGGRAQPKKKRVAKLSKKGKDTVREYLDGLLMYPHRLGPVVRVVLSWIGVEAFKGVIGGRADDALVELVRRLRGGDMQKQRTEGVQKGFEHKFEQQQQPGHEEVPPPVVAPEAPPGLLVAGLDPITTGMVSVSLFLARIVAWLRRRQRKT